MSTIDRQVYNLKDYPSLTIINNINTKPEKAGNSKNSVSYLPGRLLYAALEIGFIHHEMFTRSAQDPYPIYRLTYLTGVVAGAAFGLYKAAFKGDVEPRLEKRAETFAQQGALTKGIMLAELLVSGPGILTVLESEPIKDLGLGNFAALGWGFSLGADLSRYAYQNLVSK